MASQSANRDGCVSIAEWGDEQEVMLRESISKIGVEVLRSLIADRVGEGKTLEYKREMPGGPDGGRVRFLKAVSAFANTAGGDLLLGVEAVDGVATALPGFDLDNPDGETLRLENMIREGLEPRLPRVDTSAVEVAEHRYVLVVRVARSWIAPHRVRKNREFYARNSAGTYPLDVGELRTAFTMSETVAERIRDFRTDRMARIHGRETPVALNAGGCMIVHVLPLSAFTGAAEIDIAAYEADANRLSPMGASGWDWRINLDGLVTYRAMPGSASRAYAQTFRNGAAEWALVLRGHEERMMLPSAAFEQDVMRCLTDYLGFAAAFDIEPPYYVFLSFAGVRGCQLVGPRETHWLEERLTLREDILVVPEVVIEDRDVQPARVLRPAFDRVWNAFGFARSLNYDDAGEWEER